MQGSVQHERLPEFWNRVGFLFGLTGRFSQRGSFLVSKYLCETSKWVKSGILCSAKYVSPEEKPRDSYKGKQFLVGGEKSGRTPDTYFGLDNSKKHLYIGEVSLSSSHCLSCHLSTNSCMPLA